VKKISFRYIATVLLLSATLAGYGLSERRKPDVLEQPLETVDKQIAGWAAVSDEPLSDSVLDRLQLTL